MLAKKEAELKAIPFSNYLRDSNATMQAAGALKFSINTLENLISEKIDSPRWKEANGYEQAQKDHQQILDRTANYTGGFGFVLLLSAALTASHKRKEAIETLPFR
jgi:hypothetical protein